MSTFSPGTLKSVVEGLSRGGAARIDGEITTVPPAWKVRKIDLGERSKSAVTVPWGDVSTAYYSTDIENIETYAAVPGFAARVMKRTERLASLAGSQPVQRALKQLIDATVTGPTADQRARNTTRVWGEIETEDGESAAARLRLPDTYDFTARTACEVARRVLTGDVEAGFQTPASAFGPEFVLDFEGVEREDVPR